MLKFMRKYATGYMIKAMFGLIIIVFIFWGVGSFRESDRVVAEVGPHKISLTEYQGEYNRLLSMYRTVYKDRFDDTMLKELKLKEKAMESLIDRYLLLIKAEEVGITVSDREFKDYIESLEMFKRDGKFSEATYKEMLKRSGVDPKQFEKTEKLALVNGKMISLITDTGASLGEGDLWRSYVRDRGRINLGYAVFDPASFRDKVTVDDQEVAAAYEKEKGSHKTENIYRLKYLVVDGRSQIKDDAVYLELLKARDVDAYGKDKGLPVVDLGPMKEGDLLKRLKNVKAEEWLTGLKKGDISLPIRGDGKSFIFQVVDREEGKPIDKDVVQASIKERIRSEKAKARAKEAAQEAINKKSVDGKGDTGFLSRNSLTIPNLGSLAREDAGVLALSSDNKVYEKPVDLGGRYYVFYLKEEQLPSKEQWEKEKEGYRQYVLAKSKDDFLKSFMDKLRQKEKVKINWEDT